MSLDLFVSFPMEDAAEIEDLFRKSEDQLAFEIHEIIIRYAELMVTLARTLCPFLTGRLSFSIYYEITEDGIDILCGTSYWGYQEFGTRYIEGKHFISQAVVTYEQEMYAEIDRVVAEYFEG